MCVTLKFKWKCVTLNLSEVEVCNWKKNSVFPRFYWLLPGDNQSEPCYLPVCVDEDTKKPKVKVPKHTGILEILWIFIG